MIAYQNHEYYSQVVARNFLGRKNWPPAEINRVTGCIAATKMPQKPTTLLEEILCDADLAHLAEPDFGSWRINCDRNGQQYCSGSIPIDNGCN